MEDNLNVAKVPVDKDGNVVWHPGRSGDYEYADNARFNAWLTPVKCIKHGRQLKFLFESHDRTKAYEVFPEDIFDFLPHMNNGKIAGNFEYVCRGWNYGIRLVHASI